MKKLSIKNYILITLAILITGAAIWLPGFLMHKDSDSFYGKVGDVPSEYYSGPSESIIKNASKQLTEEQCNQLITGVWESEVTPVSEEDCKYTGFGMKTLVVGHINDLYAKGLYPRNLSSDTDNWYSWEAKPYRALDSTFKTYAAFFWEINFTKFDGSETHRFIVSEYGDILYAEANTKESLGKFTPKLSNGSYLLDYFGYADVFYTTYSTSDNDDNIITSVTVDDVAKAFKTDEVSSAAKNNIQKQIDSSSSFIPDFTTFKPDESLWLKQTGGTSINYSISTCTTYNNYKLILLPEKTQ